MCCAFPGEFVVAIQSQESVSDIAAMKEQNSA